MEPLTPDAMDELVALSLRMQRSNSASEAEQRSLAKAYRALRSRLLATAGPDVAERLARIDDAIGARFVPAPR
jgi:hypothetical protein